MFKGVKVQISIVLIVLLSFVFLFCGTLGAAESNEMTIQQSNAINMLNYLRAMTQEIRSSKYNRLFLEGAYSELINNTRPNAIDSATLSEVIDLLDKGELRLLDDELRNLAGNTGIDSEQKQEQYQEYAEKLMDLLIDNVPDLLKKEEFYSRTFPSVK